MASQTVADADYAIDVDDAMARLDEYLASCEAKNGPLSVEIMEAVLADRAAADAEVGYVR